MISASFVSEKGLLRLRLSVTHRPEPNCLQVDLTHGDEDWICGWTTPLASLNAGTTDRTAERSYGTERDPSREACLGEPLKALFSGLKSRVSGHTALWLELARPKGILPCLPWERWLAPLLGVPILRLPRHLFKPVRSGGTMHVAWCAGPSSEDPAARVARLAASLAGLEHANARPAFHVFADEELEAAMGAFAAEKSAVTLYPTDRCRTYSNTGDGGGPITDPWLRWMSRDLPHGIDLACFDAHGSLSRGRGGLLFSNTPLRGTSEGLRIDGDELTTFLDATGASGLVLASPPGNPSLSALLTLADEIVDGRPGPVLCHDGEEDPGGAELGQGLAFLYGDDDRVPASPRLSLYSHPDRLGKTGEISIEDQGLSTSIYSPPKGPDRPQASPNPLKILADFTLAERIRPPAGTSFGMTAPSVMPPLPEDFAGKEGGGYAVEEGAPPEPPPPPRWLEASQRVLERHVAWSSETGEAVSAVGKAAQEGTEDALRFIKGLLSKTGKGDAS